MSTHPTANPQDRYTVSSSVQSYLTAMQQEYPDMWNKLKILRSALANDYHCLC
jgi:hypothetical protein